jgi:hypothetical protein
LIKSNSNQLGKFGLIRKEHCSFRPGPKRLAHNSPQPPTFVSTADRRRSAHLIDFEADATIDLSSRGELHSRPPPLLVLGASPPPPLLEVTGPHRRSPSPSLSSERCRFSTTEPPRRRAPSVVSCCCREFARRHPLSAPMLYVETNRRSGHHSATESGQRAVTASARTALAIRLGQQCQAPSRFEPTAMRRF